MNYHGKKFNQDKAAHQIYAFAMDSKNMQNGNTDRLCYHCKGHIKVYYCENKLYLVRCIHCGIAALVQASSPNEAVCKTIGSNGEHN